MPDLKRFSNGRMYRFSGNLSKGGLPKSLPLWKGTSNTPRIIISHVLILSCDEKALRDNLVNQYSKLKRKKVRAVINQALFENVWLVLVTLDKAYEFHIKSDSIFV